MNAGKYYLSLLLVSLCFSSAYAQEQEDANTVDQSFNPITHQWLRIGESGQTTPWFVPFYQMSQHGFVAEDGNYLAQTEEELQTYYDLAMSYQYIESPQIRALLQLNEDEGIIIESVEPDGLGQKAGFLAGDLVLKVDDAPVRTQYEFVIALTGKRGEPASACIRRIGEIQNLSFKLDPVFFEKRTNWIIGVFAEELSELMRLHLGFDGAVITSLTEGGPAENMGLRVNDIILEINGIKVANGEQLREAIQSSQGAALTIAVVRAGNKMTVELKPVELEETSTSSSTFYDPVPLYASGVLAAPSINRVPMQQWALASNLEYSASDQGKLEDISRQLELLQQQVEALRESIDK